MKRDLELECHQEETVLEAAGVCSDPRGQN